MKVPAIFASVADDYARHRPTYPEALYAWLASLAPGRELAWDCGTGSGQAARGLSAHFARVVATDASREQIERAPSVAGVEYRVEPADRVSLASSTVDLVTVAVAVHWFDLDRFYREVRRVLKPGGILAVWTYHLPEISEEIDAALRTYYSETVKQYWPPGFHYLDERYRTLPFPFGEIDPPAFTARAEWDLRQLVGFLASWSASQSYREKTGRDPLDEIRPALSAAWGPETLRREIRWPLHMRVGR